jgi:DNA-binding Lrp family transcriptional regulator
VNGQVENVIQKLTKLPYVYNAAVVPGEFDVIATLYGNSYEALLTQALKIGQIQGITSSETLFAYKPVWA